MNERQLFDQALAFHNAGQFPQAESLYRRVLDVNPRHADALHLLGILATQFGQQSSAVDLIQRAIRQAPRNPSFYGSLGEAYRLLDDFPTAELAYRKAIKLKPDWAEAHGNLGVVLEAQGQLDAAEACYERVMRLHAPTDLDYVNLGNIANKRGDARKAEQSYRRAVELNARSVEALTNLGNLAQEAERYAEARNYFMQALPLSDPSLSLLLGLGRALNGLGEFKHAIEIFQRATHRFPQSYDAHNGLGLTYGDMGEWQQALACYQDAIKLNPDDAAAYNNMGNAWKSLGDLDAAREFYAKALALEPNHPQAVVNFGIFSMQRGDITEAIDCFERALALAPQYVNAGRCLLASRLYDCDATPEFLFEAHQAFARRHRLSEVATPSVFRNVREPGRKLRLGYVSSDFHSHPVARNLSPVFDLTDRSQFEIFCYAHVGKPDDATHWFQAHSDAWRSIYGMTDAEASALIRADNVDILIILAGRFDDNRPLIALYHAAPIQVSFHDPATSGLAEMDYLFTDITLSPRKTREWFTERLIRLPTFYTHAPIENAPDVGVLPAIETGHIRFASFNNPAKVNAKVARLWCDVLKAVPHSTLSLKFHAVYAVPSIRDRYLDMFAAQGIDPARLILSGVKEETETHLSRYQQVDIALDPFPFTGSTTTFEALWMGVPVVTLAGETMVSRWSASMLRRVGLEELIAHTPEDYVRTAQTLAQDLPRLAELRRTLRERVADSPLCDARARTRQLERAYRWMWRKWCTDHAG